MALCILLSHYVIEMSAEERDKRPPAMLTTPFYSVSPVKCANCGCELERTVGTISKSIPFTNGVLIEQVSKEGLEYAAPHSWNWSMDVWFKAGFGGKWICRECFWK